jgi:hypothetical protein
MASELTAPAALAGGIESAAGLTSWLLADFSAADLLYRPTAEANCAAWIVGHLVVSSRMMMTRLGVTEFPTLPEGFETKFARDDVAPKLADYGDTSKLAEIFTKHHELFARHVAGMAASKLAEPLAAPHPRFKTFGELAGFATVHIALHAGHLSLIRRMLGRGPLV